MHALVTNRWQSDLLWFSMLFWLAGLTWFSMLFWLAGLACSSGSAAELFF